MPLLKIGVAMSGGVDSTMAASLLLEQGYRVQGFFMQLPLTRQAALEQRVRQAADCLAVPLTVIDLRHRFTELVIRSFVDRYRAGLTPNPCIHCNCTIKFDLLARSMREAGMERIATGHYARIFQKEGRPWIGRGHDPLKDQSYFLARLQAEQLRSLVFPLGGWTKAAVVRRAKEQGFLFNDEESQDVCFLDTDLGSFLAAHGLGEQTGPVVSLDGRILGEHRGIWRYTIGQRRGLGLPDATPWYVVGLDGPANRVIVGKNTDLLQHRCPLSALRWTHEPFVLPWRGVVQLRSRHAPACAVLSRTGPDGWQLDFDQPQRAITPGQFAVLYEEDRVIGSAVIGIAQPEDNQ